MECKFATVVTGASQGIGKAIALRMAQTGTAQILVARTERKLKAVCKLIRDRGGIAEYVVGDVSDPQTAQAVLKLVREKRWRVRNLICNAGIATGGPIATLDLSKLDQLYAVNVKGPALFVQTLLPSLKASRRGVICIVSSMAGVKPYKNQTAYCATKHAQVGMAGCWALELAKHKIDVYVICPGQVETDMTKRTIASQVKHRGLTPKEARAKIKAVSPQNRIMPAREVAEMVEIACSRRVRSVSGRPTFMGGGE